MADHARWTRSVFTVFLLAGFLLTSWLGRLPDVRDELSATPSQMSLLLLGLAAGSIAGLRGAARVVEQVGERRCVSAASGFLAAGLAAAAIAVAVNAPLALLVAALVIFGFGHGLCDVAMNLSGAAVERRRGRSLMPRLHAGFSFGTLAAAGLAAAAAALDVSIALHLLVVAVAASAGVAVAARRFESSTAPTGPASEPQPTAARPPRSPWRDHRILTIGVVVLGMTLAEGSANDWLALAVVDGPRVSNAGGGAALALFVAAMTFGRLLGTQVLDRFGRVLVLRASAVLAAAGLLIVIFAGSVPMVMFGVACWGLGASLGFPVGMSAAADGDPARAAANVSAVATIGYVAFLAGPIAIGALGEHVGLLDALLVIVGATAVAGLTAGATRQLPSGPDAASRDASAMHT